MDGLMWVPARILTSGWCVTTRAIQNPPGMEFPVYWYMPRRFPPVPKRFRGSAITKQGMAGKK